MKRWLLLLAALLGFVSWGPAALAQGVTVNSGTTCPTNLPVGSNQPIPAVQNGICINGAISGTFTPASNGATGAAVPASADYIGANKAGNLTGLTLDSSSNLNVNVNAALPAGTNVIGVVGVAQASTTSGQSGPLVQGAVTTSAPAYTTGQTAPLSLDTTGALRITAPAAAPVNVTVNTPPNDLLQGPQNVTGATDVVVNSQGSGAAALQITGTFTGLSGLIRASVDGTNYVNVGAYNANTGAILTAGTTITGAGIYVIPAAGYRFVEYHVTAVSTGTAVVDLNSSAGALDPPNSVSTGGKNVNATNFPTTVDTNSGSSGASTLRTVLATNGTTHGQTVALATAKVLKASAGVLYTLDVQADSTLNAAAWYVLVLDATSDPGNGSVTPAKCYTVPSGTSSFTAGWPTTGVAMTTGITVVVSTTGCFTETQSAHAFIGGEFQ